MLRSEIKMEEELRSECGLENNALNETAKI